MGGGRGWDKEKGRNMLSHATHPFALCMLPSLLHCLLVALFCAFLHFCVLCAAFCAFHPLQHVPYPACASHAFLSSATHVR